MENTKDLISKARGLYGSRNYFDAKSQLFLALEDPEIDEITKYKIYILIADVCFKINEFEITERYLLKYVEKYNLNPELSNWLGNTYLKRRDYKNSEKFYLKSIKLDNNETALINLAILYHNLGDQKKAISLYNEILAKNSKNIGALYNLSNLDKSIINKKTLNFLENLIKENKLSNFDTASCYFLLAENEKNKKNFENEIEFLSKANNYSFKEKEKKNKQVNEYWLNVIPKKFNKIKYFSNKNSLNKIDKIFPIFIVGLPRCGSTLIESIISSGKDEVENLGETNLVNWAFLNTNRDILHNSINEEKKISIDFDKTENRLKNSFNNLNIKKNDKIFFSEKSLENFYYIELILNIYPNAKFINPYRNLIDNIFAIYKQFLSNVSWSHSLEDILLYIDNYLSTISFFKQKYPNNIFSISLENFTNYPKKLSMEMYEFCNLGWDEKCLEFHKRKDLFINTASNNQIRNSVQKYDSSKYQYYKQMLDPYLKKYDWINLSLKN